MAFFLASEHGPDFAGRAVVGMLAGTISQVAFALAYRGARGRSWPEAFTVGSAAFAASTLVLALGSWRAPLTFAVVCAALAVGFVVVRGADAEPTAAAVAHPPRWDVPTRMALATGVVVAITTLAPVLGPHLAGLLSPFPVFGAVLAVFTHRTHGGAAAGAVLGGLVLGLGAPAVFFLVLALALPSVGLVSLALASAAALAV